MIAVIFVLNGCGDSSSEKSSAVEMHSSASDNRIDLEEDVYLPLPPTFNAGPATLPSREEPTDIEEAQAFEILLYDPKLSDERIRVFKLQLALDRLGISPGPLDGKMGRQTRAALLAFQIHSGLDPGGEFDAATRQALPMEDADLFETYVLTESDFAQLGAVPGGWLAKSQQERLPYESILELVSEKGHAYESFIRELNPFIDWEKAAPGQPVVIPKVGHPSVTGKANLIRIKLREKLLLVLGENGELLGHYPCSIARDVEQRPVGVLHVESVAENPDYTFDPDNFPESEEAQRIGQLLTIPPGPNNPVGTAWIGLNKPGFGIHGTPEPESVGRAESHGCFRLANWNAQRLIQLVEVGMPVFVEP